MQIRPATVTDLPGLEEIDATIESLRYLHLDRTGQDLNLQWKIEDRPLRTRLIESNPLTDEQRFFARQIVTGVDEGIATVVEHDDQPIALMLAQPRPLRGTLKLIDLRVDYDHRREGLATGLVYQLIQTARETKCRAVAAQTRANNFPANQLMARLGFEIAGLDAQRHSNHDLVKESVTLFWYAAVD